LGSGVALRRELTSGDCKSTAALPGVGRAVLQAWWGDLSVRGEPSVEVDRVSD
jgi:hypothetical protein